MDAVQALLEMTQAHRGALEATLETLGDQLADVVDIEARLEELARQTAKPDPVTNVSNLTPPWMSQLNPITANYAKGDCGTACLAMWLNLLGKGVNVDDVSIATGLPAGFRFTVFGNLKTAAAKWKVKLEWWRNQTIQDIYTQLNQRRPVIALVHYPSLPHRWDPDYPYSHWILVYDACNNHLVYHDPYYPMNDTRGQGVEIDRQTFAEAWARNHLAGNRYSDRAMIVQG